MYTTNPKSDTLKVLVVDDDAAVAHRIAVQVEEAGCEAACLADYPETLAYLRMPRREIDLALVDARLPQLPTLVSAIRTLPARSELPVYAISGYCSRAGDQVPSHANALLYRPLPSGILLHDTLRDLTGYARGEYNAFVPLDQAAAELRIEPDEVRQQLYAPVLASMGPAVRECEVALYAQFAGQLDYARAIHKAFSQGPWRDLSWRARAYLFNEGLAPEMRISWRSLKRIAQGQDRELARAIRVLAALDFKLSLDLEALLTKEAPE